MLIVFHWRILMEIIVLLIQNYLYGLYNYFKMNVGSFTVKNNLPVKFSDQFFSSILIFCIKHFCCSRSKRPRFCNCVRQYEKIYNRLILCDL